MRKPIVAGKFYSEEGEVLQHEVEGLLFPEMNKIKAVGAVVPHAGYMFSGEVAGQVYSSMEKVKTYIIIGPNHTGQGERFSTIIQNWQIPTGIVNVDQAILTGILDKAPIIRIDDKAHIFEHSIEVQLPFIHCVSPEASIVPLVVQGGTIDELQTVAKSIVDAIQEKDREVVIIASSDMTHYEPRQEASRKDQVAISYIEKIDPEGLLEFVERERVSMCGAIPVTLMLMCSRLLGADNSRLVKYTDSAESNGDKNSVVGYAGMVVY